MSGIAGIQNAGASAAVAAMLDRIRHRGPDGRMIAGLSGHIFGAAHLSLRPSDSAGPFIQNEKMVVWDGEIYDFEDLKGVCGSNAESDPELIIDLYNMEGPDFLARLNGPFALALLDGDDLMLARDQLGQAPLYYGTVEGRFCFASEIKAFSDDTEGIRIFPAGHFMSRGDFKSIPLREAG
ncbi:MAG: hypothetical protein ACYDH0_09535, partial [Candidatus Aminicenantales bacterium]